MPGHFQRLGINCLAKGTGPDEDLKFIYPFSGIVKTPAGLTVNRTPISTDGQLSGP